MTPRERILSIGVGAALAIAVGSYILNGIREGFKTKQARVEQLESELLKRESSISDGLLDRKRLQMVAERSLPSDGENAQSDYTEWLIDLVDQSGITSPKWSFNNKSIPEKGVYKKYLFTVSGSGTIENLNKLLYHFYSKDYLHRITSMKISPVLNAPYQLTMQMTGEVLALDAASAKQAPPDWTSPRVKKTLDEYKLALTQRNIFSPSNHVPDWPERTSVTAPRGTAFSYTPSARDRDPGQSISYDVVGKVPDGMRISNGSISWLPEANGTYEVELLATDNGIPQGWSTQKLVIEVVDPVKPPDPPPAPPKFDVASQAEVSALVAGRNGPEAWVRSKLEGKTFYLKVGDELNLGEVHGKVVSVGANYMEVETEGKRWTVGLDESLADAFKRMNID